MNATFNREELLDWLAGYSAAMELMAISVLAGSRKVASCPALGDFHDEYRRVVPGGRAPVKQLAAAHRRVVLALRELRDARYDLDNHAQELHLARREHAAIVMAALAELRPVGVLRMGKA
ncbi:hypothetical protein ACPWT1_21460 [Ramlibacter sp. MMS24-I3-19]|uniref:hypothetical protein n=1 Tax=Ramlibacter sp. MMS24-I3-19 TaxID=3416606 RepID=UPI003D069046